MPAVRLASLSFLSRSRVSSSFLKIMMITMHAAGSMVKLNMFVSCGVDRSLLFATQERSEIATNCF